MKKPRTKKISIYASSSRGISKMEVIIVLSAQKDLFRLKNRKAEPNTAVSWIRPARQDAMTLPNIILAGFALVIRSSIARELFSVATLVATICP